MQGDQTYNPGNGSLACYPLHYGSSFSLNKKHIPNKEVGAMGLMYLVF